MSWHRLRSILAPLLAMLLVLTSVVSVSAAPQAPPDSELIPLLQSYGLVKGDQFGNMNLFSPITRAEAATVFVRAVGQEQAAKLVATVSSFPDTNGHWAAGYITTAFRLGQMKGRENGMFDPDARITNAEVLTVILRIVHKEPTGIWTPVRAVQAARDLGIYTEGSAEMVANLEAVRGSMFRSLAKAITTVPLEDGRTVLATYTDKDAPSLKVDALPASTGNDKVTVSGSTTAAAYVLVNGQKATLSASGSFSLETTLVPGDNKFDVEAFDWAGNRAVQGMSIARATDAAKIEVTGDLSVVAGRSTTLTVSVFDSKGIRLPASTLSAKVSGNLGTFTANTGVFTAGNTAGKATITFTAGKITKAVDVEILGPAQEAYSLFIPSTSLVATTNKAVTVNVQVLDRSGKVVTWDSGRPVTLSTTALPGLQITSSNIVLSNHGVATFTLQGSTEGASTLSATSPGLTGSSALLQIASSTRVVLFATPSSSVADGSTPIYIRAVLQDENGATVTNTSGRDVVVQLSTSGSSYSTLTNSTTVIRAGTSSSSGYDGLLVPGLQSESVAISGSVRSGQTYTVTTTTASFFRSAVGTPARMDIAAGSGFSPNTDITLSVSTRDASNNVVSAGSYAFKVQVTTNNGEPITNGLPDGVTLRMGNTALVPVDGATGVTAVTGRTSSGFANITLRYNKSGNVTVKLIPATGVGGASDSTGAVAAATSSVGFTMGERMVSFAGTAAGLQARVDLPSLGLFDQPWGILGATGSGSAKIKLYVVDTVGGRVSVSGTASLTKTGTATTPVVSSAAVVNGVAEFPITSTTTAGTDFYTLTFNGLPSASTTVQVTTTTAAFQTKPSILSIYGQSGGINRVTPTDNYMEIQLPNYGSGIVGIVSVYRVGTGARVYSSPVMEFNGGPFIRVPRANLVSPGSAYGLADGFYVRINTGFGESVPSDRFPAPPGNVVVEAPLTTNIYQVRYNAATQVLTAYASGITAGGVIDTSKMSLQVTGTSAVTPTLGPTCTVQSGYFTCPGVVIGAVDGTVTLATSDGWFRYDNYGQIALADSTSVDNLVQPLAFIKSATVNFKTNGDADVTLYGSNLAPGYIYPQYLTVGGAPLGTSGQVIAAGASSEVTFTVPASLAGSLAPGGMINTAPGWFVIGTDPAPAVTNVPLFKKFQVNSVSYDKYTNKLSIIGSGFDGASAALTPASLYIMTVSGTKVVPALSTSSPIVYNATQIDLILDTTLADTLEATTGQLFLASQVSTPSVSWFTNGGWLAKELGERSYPLAITDSTPPAP